MVTRTSDGKGETEREQMKGDSGQRHSVGTQRRLV
ncbi:hypothetical protein E2C01_035118 [Portunus trituberculatus]|uniref:Uncharacterized protein n=1 Tax=Portunus trituberculatus TaxID=210409 RepID=A0A5B7F4Q9_PORTR|nr:hypothetical protein [Portunus trituberculatus]